MTSNRKKASSHALDFVIFQGVSYDLNGLTHIETHSFLHWTPAIYFALTGLNEFRKVNRSLKIPVIPEGPELINTQVALLQMNLFLLVLKIGISEFPGQIPSTWSVLKRELDL